MKKFWVLIISTMFCSCVLVWQAFGEEVSNQAVEERIKKLEEMVGQDGNQKWNDRITISGVIEVEAGFSNADFNDEGTDDVDESDIVLATFELGIDAEIHNHVSGHVLLLYEEDENDGDIAIDEGYITLDGKPALPLYFKAGQFYLPFGQFESHMITDPVTLDLGETNQSAVQIGFANDVIEASLAIFNGDIDEVDDDNTIGSYAANIIYSLPEDTVANVELTAGVSFISNLADSDAFEGFLAADTVEDQVAGIGVFISFTLMDLVTLEAEYIGAMDEFKVSDLAFADGDELSPVAWNLELAVTPMEYLELALRYAQTDDFKGGIVDEVLPETQYGVCASYGLFDRTAISLEYLKSDFENDDELSVITAQLAVEF